jgi:hypothetical protein
MAYPGARSCRRMPCWTGISGDPRRGASARVDLCWGRLGSRLGQRSKYSSSDLSLRITKAGGQCEVQGGAEVCEGAAPYNLRVLRAAPAVSGTNPLSTPSSPPSQAFLQLARRGSTARVAGACRNHVSSITPPGDAAYRVGTLGCAGRSERGLLWRPRGPRRTQVTTTRFPPFRVRLDPSGVHEMKLVS